MNYTSISQSKKLVELGLNPETADMAWIDRPLRVTDCPDVPVIMDIELESMIPQNKLIPCWSLGALLGLMPAGCSLRSRKGFTADKKIYFCTCPFNNDDPINYNSSIEAAYNMVIWLLENNYIKAEKTV